MTVTGLDEGAAATDVISFVTDTNPIFEYQRGYRRRLATADDSWTAENDDSDGDSDAENQPPPSDNRHAFHRRVPHRPQTSVHHQTLLKPGNPHHSVVSAETSSYQRTILGELSILEWPAVSSTISNEIANHHSFVQTEARHELQQESDVRDYSPSRNTPVTLPDHEDIVDHGALGSHVQSPALTPPPLGENGTQPVTPEPIINRPDTPNDHTKLKPAHDSPGISALEDLLGDLKRLKMRAQEDTRRCQEDVMFAIRRSKLLVSRQHSQ